MRRLMAVAHETFRPLAYVWFQHNIIFECEVNTPSNPYQSTHALLLTCPSQACEIAELWQNVRLS